MATITIGNRKVTVDDAFLSLPPEQQAATVDEIASQLGMTGGSGPIEQGPGVLKLQGRVTPSQGVQGGSTNILNLAKDPTLMDQVGAFSAGVADLPIIGPWLGDRRTDLQAGMVSAASGQDYDEVRKRLALNEEYLRERAPIARLGGQVAGSVGAFGGLGALPGVGRVLGAVGSIPSRVGWGAASSAAITGGDTLARGGSLEEAGRNALIAGPVGGVLSGAGGVLARGATKGAQHRATSAAIQNAPASGDLKAAAQQLFSQVDNSGAGVDQNRFMQFAADLVQRARSERINPTLDSGAISAFEELAGLAQDAMQAGRPLAFGELHNLRQIAQAAAGTPGGRNSRFANQIVHGLDDLIANLKPGEVVGGPVGTGNTLLQAISTWGRARRVGLIEEAIYKAQNVASGFENGIRNEFRKLLQSPETRRLFTAAEVQEIERVVRGTTGANIMKLIGKFGFGSGNASNMLGGSIGASVGAGLGGLLGPLGVPAGAAIAGGGATLARRASEALTSRAAQRAAQVVATPNVPVLSQTMRRSLPPAGVVPHLLPDPERRASGY